MWFGGAAVGRLLIPKGIARLETTMAEERLKTVMGHLRGGSMTNLVKVLEERTLFDEVNKRLASGTASGASSRHRFTLENSRLSKEQRDFYEENGYVVIRSLVNPVDLDRYKRRFQDIVEGRVKVPGLVVMKDVALVGANSDERVVNKLQELYVDDVLFQYCTLPQILDYAECFCGPNLMAMHTMLINKPPDVGTLTSRHPLHQDLYYFPFRPADRIVCAWTALERVTRDNGCLVALPGSHKGELLEHGYPDWEGGVNKMYHGVKNLSEKDMENRVYLEMEAGDTVLFHPVLIHGSGANRTKGFRKAISCHYAASECEYIDVTGTPQEVIAKEVLEITRRRVPGVEVGSYADVWKLRGRLVRGVEVNL